MMDAGLPFEDAAVKSRTLCDTLSTSGRFENESDVLENIQFLNGYLGQWMHDRGMKQSAALMDLMLDRNMDKYRQDNVTPTSLHEMTQAIWFISCVEDGLHVEDVEGVLSVIFAHDLGENFGDTPEDMNTYLTEQGITDRDAIERFKTSFDVITKQYRDKESGEKGPLKHAHNRDYNAALVQDQNASVAKMFDRPHNIMTLIGAKKLKKMISYMAHIVDEQDDYVREASANFPSQAELYETLQHITIGETAVTQIEIDIAQKRSVGNGTQLEILGDMPDRGFKNLPAGIHPYEVIADRIRHQYPNVFMVDDPNGQSPS